MALSATGVSKAKATDKPQKLSDGDGVFNAQTVITFVVKITSPCCYHDSYQPVACLSEQ